MAAAKIDIPLEPDIETELCCFIGDGGLVRGYKKELLTENLSERETAFLICPRCQGILREACLLTSGEQLCFCCVKEDEQSIPNVSIRNTVISLKCSCPLSNRGCEWLGILGDCENHLSSCSHVYVKCKLGCGVVLQRYEVNNHLREVCVHRELECETCGIKYVESDTFQHLVECVQGCGGCVCQDKMELHKETECAMVKCPFEKHKCGVGLINRQKLKQHLEENKTLHTELKLTAMEDIIERQGNTIDMMAQQMELLRTDLKNKNGNTKFKLSASEDSENDTIRELTQQVGSLTRDLVCLTKYLEISNEQTRDLKYIFQIYHPTEKFKYKIAAADNILDKGVYTFGSSDVFHFAGYNFKFSHETVENNLAIYFSSQGGKDYDKLTWPFKAEFITCVINHSDPCKTMEFKSELIEISKGDYNGFSRGRQLAAIPISTQTVPGFLRKGCFDMEIFLLLKKKN